MATLHRGEQRSPAIASISQLGAVLFAQSMTSAPNSLCASSHREYGYDTVQVAESPAPKQGMHNADCKTAPRDGDAKSRRRLRVALATSDKGHVLTRLAMRRHEFRMAEQSQQLIHRTMTPLPICGDPFLDPKAKR